MGIASDVAAEALAEVFGDLDERALIAQGAPEEAARPDAALNDRGRITRGSSST